MSTITEEITTLTVTVESMVAEIDRLRAKLEAAEKQIDAMKCCHNCEYFNVVFDECEGSPNHCPTGHFEHWQPKGGE